MRRVFGAKKNTEPPPSIQDASDRVCPLSFLLSSISLCNMSCVENYESDSLRYVVSRPNRVFDHRSDDCDFFRFN